MRDAGILPKSNERLSGGELSRSFVFSVFSIPQVRIGLRSLLQISCETANDARGCQREEVSVHIPSCCKVDDCRQLRQKGSSARIFDGH